ncbi:MAG: MarR family transcriptional regulator [Anaeroplasmataceae bacterium]|nr:MarR family transcriptional regulator [Anaeroplasmataceae bacterium]
MERKELLSLLQKCGHHLHHQKGKKLGQYRILLILKDHPNLPQSDLLGCLHIQAGSLSEILLKMESSNLIIRTKDSLDKRRVLLSLSEAGLLKVNTLIKEYEAENEMLLSTLTDEECMVLYSLLSRLYKNWKGEDYA